MRPNIKVSAPRLLAAAGALALATALGGCLGYDGDFDRGYQIDQQSLEQVQVGETTKPQALGADGHAVDDLDRRRRRLVLHRPEDVSARSRSCRRR